MKKISYEEYAILLGFQKKHTIERLACNHYIEEQGHSVKAIAKVKLPVYIALFVPACIFQAFALMWDGGLKNFEIESRTFSNHIVWKDTPRYKKFLEKSA